MTGSEQDPLDRAESVLRHHWGHPALRPGQVSVLRDALAGGDVLGILPTGGGKSLCYQIPAMLDDGITLVVSPLVALMADQVSGLSARGVPATWLGSSLEYAESEQRWNDLAAGRYRLLYVAPERLRSDRFRARAHRLRICRIAVDEAHCVSEWGHDFRPDFLRIATTRSELGDPPITAVTATATPPVRRDIVRLLGLRDPAVHVHGFDRPNIVWSVFEDSDKPGRVRDVLEAVPGGGIIYCGTRRGVEAWAERLRRRGESVDAYHAGLPSAERWRAQEAWTQGHTRVIVATSAFGMGIDRPDVRFVLHVEPPASVESYYQEAGRAGRDGRSAHAVLLATERDRGERMERLKAEHPDTATVRRVFDVTCSMAGVAVGSIPTEPLAVDLHGVARSCRLSVTAVRRAVEIATLSGIWTPRSTPDGHGVLRMLVSADTLRRWSETDGTSRYRPVLEHLIRRLDPAAWSGFVDVDLRVLARGCKTGPGAVDDLVQALRERGWVRWQPQGGGVLLDMDVPRPGRVPVDASAIRRSRRRARERFRDMVAYVEARGCRRRFLLAYFGESASEHCGRCDACTGRHEAYVPGPSDEGPLWAILAAVDAGERLDRNAALETTPGWRRRQMADWLVSQGFLEHADAGYRLTTSGRERLSTADQGVRSALS